MADRLARFQGEFARYLLQGDPQAPDALRGTLACSASPGALASARIEAGLRVYRNNVLYSLTQALAAQFPVVARLVGRDFFTALAREYVRGEPPHEPPLTYYGHLFPDFIAAHPACRALPYLPDVARLELLCQRALHAADERPLDPGTLAQRAGDELERARFKLLACAHLFSSRYPVDRIWAANVAEADAQIQLEEGCFPMLVYRDEWTVKVVSLQPPAFALLQALAARHSLHEACASLLQHHGDAADTITPLLAFVFGLRVLTEATPQTTELSP